jgi:hypothetical protein
MNKMHSLRELKQTIYLLALLSLVLFVPQHATAQHGSQTATGIIHISVTVVENNPSVGIESEAILLSKLFGSDASIQNLDEEKSADVKFDNNNSSIFNRSISEYTKSGEKISEDLIIENRFVNARLGTSTILDTRGRLYIHQQPRSDISSATQSQSQPFQNDLMVVAVNE